MIDHIDIPGTLLTFFHQASRPTTEDSKGRFKHLAQPKELRVSGMFDVTQILLNGADENITAIMRGVLEAQSIKAERLREAKQAGAPAARPRP